MEFARYQYRGQPRLYQSYSFKFQLRVCWDYQMIRSSYSTDNFQFSAFDY